MSLLLSRRYSVFGKLLKRRHKSVVDGDRRSGNIFESSRGQFADMYSCENNATGTKEKFNLGDTSVKSLVTGIQVFSRIL